jgi:hypothetical protein
LSILSLNFMSNHTQKGIKFFGGHL